MKTSGGIVSRAPGFWSSILLLPLLYFSCETNFEPSGENFVEIDTTVNIQANVTLSQDDTLGLLILDDQTYISFNLDIGALHLYELQVTIDEQIVFTGNQVSDSFYYDPNQYSDGLHLLKIEFITNSGRGSLADLSMAEGYQFYQEWEILSISNSPPEPLSIIGVYPYQGGLKVDWEEYDRLYFENYRLTSSIQLYTSTHPDDVTFIDPYYVGGEVSYRLEINTPNGTARSAAFTYMSPFPDITNFEQLAPDIISVNWSKCDYPSNFGKYVVGLESIGSQVFTQVNDTSAIFENVPFGEPLYCYISTWPNTELDVHEYVQYNSEATVWTGADIGVSSRKVDFIPGSDRLYLSNYWEIKRLEYSDMSVVAAYELPSYGAVDVSQDGTHIATREYQAIARLDPEMLEVISEPDLESLIGWSPQVHAIAAANGDLLFFAAQPVTSHDGIEVFAMDMAQGIILDRITLTTPDNHVNAMQCTPDGSYVVYDYEFLSFDGSHFARHHNYYNAEYLQFLPNGEQFVYATLSEPVKLFNIASMSSSVIFSSTGATSPSIDPVTGYLGYIWERNDVFKIYDLSTATHLGEFPARLAYGGHMTLFDNKVLSSAGYLRSAFE